MLCSVRIKALLAFVIAAPAFANMPPLNVPEAPWMTGTLLAPSGRITPGGHVGFQPYGYATFANHGYDEDWNKIKLEEPLWGIQYQLALTVGLTDWSDLYITPTWWFNKIAGQQSYQMGNIEAGFDIQLIEEAPNGYYPSIKLSVAEIFPTGKYDFFNPEKRGADFGGYGSYTTKVLLGGSRTIHFGGVHWLNLRFGAGYYFPRPVHLRGLNSYGGSIDTDGWIYRGQWWEVYFGFQYSLTQRWVISFDAMGANSQRAKFKGKQGTLPQGGTLNQPSSSSYSIAPALEYNWSETIGVIGGVWFTVAGRNSWAFTSYVIALNFYQ